LIDEKATFIHDEQLKSKQMLRLSIKFPSPDFIV
jgi:hypothetical protein